MAEVPAGNPRQNGALIQRVIQPGATSGDPDVHQRSGFELKETLVDFSGHPDSGFQDRWNPNSGDLGSQSGDSRVFPPPTLLRFQRGDGGGLSTPLRKLRCCVEALVQRAAPSRRGASEAAAPSGGLVVFRRCRRRPILLGGSAPAARRSLPELRTRALCEFVDVSAEGLVCPILETVGYSHPVSNRRHCVAVIRL